MNDKLKEYSGLAGLVGLAVAISGLVRQNIEGVWGWVSITMVSVGVALLLGSLILNLRGIVNFFRGRSGRAGANLGLLVIAVVAILGVLNYHGYR
ncbi:MAG: hypothetical protein ACOYLF_16430, partial [Blastocatellia bacterium]